MREKDIESWAKNIAKQDGWWVRKFKSPGRRSAPDDIFAKDGHVFFVEFKASGCLPTPLQLEEHRGMIAHGLTVWVCDNRESFKNILYRENELAYLNTG